MSLLERMQPDDKPLGLHFNRIVDALSSLRTGLISIATAVSGARYVIDSTSIRAYDGTSTNYGAPSGAGVTVEVGSDGTLFLGGVKANISITDLNGIVRAEMGNLAANGLSQAQYGFRTNDASHNPVSDSFGLIATVSQAQTNGAVNIGVSISGTTYVTINSVSLTLTRQANVIAWSQVNGTRTVGAGTGTAGIQMDGLFPSGYAPGNTQAQGDTVQLQASTNNPSFILGYWPQLSAGTHTFALVGNTASGATTFQYNGFPVVMVLGG